MEEATARRYHRFLISELITVFVCGYLIYTVDATLGYGGDPRFMLPGVILIFALLQNCGYWLYRYLKATGRISNVQPVLKIFGFLKKLTPVCLLSYPVYLIFMAATDFSSLSALITFFGAVIFALSLVEHIGMYYIDIKNMSRGGRKQPSELAAELRDKGGQA